MHSAVLSLCVIALFIFSCNAGTPTQTDMNVVKARIIAQYKKFSVYTTVTQQLMDSLATDGHWQSVNYSNRTNEPPSVHLENVKKLVTAYISDQLPAFKGSATLLAKIHLAYGYWISKDYQNKWWWNAIGLPQFHCHICLLMQPYFSTNEMNNCIKYLDRAITETLTGANLVWTAQNGLVKGIIKNDIAFVKTSSDLVWSNAVYTPNLADDGIKRDGSFFQHEQQEYSGGYGSAFTADMFQILVWCNNTNFAMPAENLGALETHVLDGQQWMMLMPQMRWDIAVKSREITRSYSSLDATVMRNWVVNPGGPRYNDWDLMIRRMNTNTAPPRIGNKAFWISDYMVHSRANWTSSVKMYSKRTQNAECINYEGKLSVHLSDGANYLYKTGDEYRNIFPLWDWALIPGTTTDQGTFPLPGCNYVHILGKTSFVGSVSDGMYGAAAHDLSGPFSSPAVAKKSWFFFDDEYVALGAGLTSPVNTTIDHRWLTGSVTVANGPTTSTVLGKAYNNLNRNAWWVHHDSIGYIFPDAPSDFSIILDSRTKTGNWISINTNNLGVTGDTFLMYMPRKTTQTYAYIVVPAISASVFANSATATKSSIKILSNTVQQQAVYHTDHRQLHATFWASQQTATYSGMSGLTIDITAMRPALVMVVPVGSDWLRISISDPTQLLAWNAISIDYPFTCWKCTNKNGATVLNVTLPTGHYAGQTVTTTIMRVKTTTTA